MGPSFWELPMHLVVNGELAVGYDVASPGAL